MKLRFYTLDVFTSRRFCGNPLAVVMDADSLTTDQMLQITREFNLSETAFVMRADHASSTARVRIFFPGGEMPFAGHPTLGTAALLSDLATESEEPFKKDLILELNVGRTPVTVTGSSLGIFGTVTVPVIPVAASQNLPSSDLIAKALNLGVKDIGFRTHTPIAISAGPTFIFVPIGSPQALSHVRINEQLWSKVISSVPEAMGAYLYTEGGEHPQTSFRARAFVTSSGVFEDPATGSATAMLAYQLMNCDSPQDGTHHWQIEQGYEMNRPSTLNLSVDTVAGKIGSVRVGGSVIRTMEGWLQI